MDINSLPLYNQARNAMDQGALEEAAVLFERSVSANPHFKALELLGECLVRLGRSREAIVPLAAATTLNNGVRAPALLAEIFLGLSEFQDAYNLAELALTRHSSNRIALQVKAMAELQLNAHNKMP